MNKVIKTAKRFLWDVSGAFGDIGVLFPIAIVLIGKNGFNPTALFLTAGMFYILSSWYFRVTMPVQPLKAMSAIAIASGLGPEVINAAGLTIGVIFLLISVTGVSVRLGDLFPKAVIRGIQLGLGLMLIKSSAGFISGDYFVAASAAVLLTISVFGIKGLPPLIPVMLLGAAVSFFRVNVGHMGPLALSPALPDAHNYWTAFNVLVLPQIALSLGNAVVATEATGKMLYAERARKLTLKSIPASMGIANVISAILGGAPMCHGSGGLTAHHKFGAATEASGYIIGAVLLVLALVFGQSGLAVLSAFPKGILGVLLCYVGIRHALFLKDIRFDARAVAIAFSVAVIGLLTNNLTIGFVSGIAIHFGLRGIRTALGYV